MVDFAVRERCFMFNQWEMILRLLLAALLGSFIGFERERLSWAAGLRTHMLVCVGSALVMIVSAFGFADVLGTPHVDLDPSRIAAQVVSGIGFLGAGAILLRGEIVRGLTTAASLWAVAAIGLAVGSGLYVVATGATAIILIILAGLKPIERWYFESRQSHELRLIVEKGRMTTRVLHEALGQGSYRVMTFVVQKSDDSPEADEVVIAFARMPFSDFDAIKKKIEAMPGVLSMKAGGG
jgi:putative Mg2+ transporter-C (MgtC) family protein